MEIKEIEYLYYGDKCMILENVEKQIELGMFEIEKDNYNIIYLEKKLNLIEEIEDEGVYKTPMIRVNGNTVKESGEIFCKECSDKYGVIVKHKVYSSMSEYESVEEKKSEIAQEDIIKILEYKGCSCSGSCGGCHKQ